MKNIPRTTLLNQKIIQPLLQPVVQRWGSWLETVIYYAEYFHEVKEIIEILDEEGILVRKAKEAVKSENVIQQQ